MGGEKPDLTDLEYALEHIPWTAGLSSYFGWTEGDNVTQFRTPLYAVPAKRVNDSIAIGLYTEEKGVDYVQLGFSQRSEFEEKLFEFGWNSPNLPKPNLDPFFADIFGSLIREKSGSLGSGSPGLIKNEARKEGVLYLPLKITEIITDLKDNSIVKLYGIKGLRYSFPFLLMYETDEGPELRGFFKQGRIPGCFYWESSIMSEETKEFISEYNQKLHNGSYRFPQLTEEEEKDLIVVSSGKPTMSAGGSSLSSRVKKKPKESSKNDDSVPTIESGELDWDKPTRIKAYLDRYVIGQDHAKKIVAVAFSNYMTRYNSKNENLPIDNILLIGPSGVGKTYMVSLLAKKAKLAMAQTKLTGKSSEGYKGENLSTVFEQICTNSKSKAPYGVVFFDEIDKLARDYWGSSSGFGSRLQDELIGWMDEAAVKGERLPTGGHSFSLNTKNILFVTAGAFRGEGEETTLEAIVEERVGKEEGRKKVGFGADVRSNDKESEEYLVRVTPEDLIKYGLKPELIGRLQSVGVLKSLTTEDKITILKEAEESRIKQYTALFKEKGFGLEIDEEVYGVIVDATPKETGARALSSVCNALFTEYLFDPQELASEDNVIHVSAEQARKFISDDIEEKWTDNEEMSRKGEDTKTGA